MTRFVRNDARAPHLEPGCTAWDILSGESVMGFVVSRLTPPTSGKEWIAYRPHPLRSMPWAPAVVAGSRAAAARVLVAGRP